MRVLVFSAALLIAATATAQDKKPPTPKGEDVSGKITLDGVPLDDGAVVFYAKDRKSTFTAAVKDGTYRTSVLAGEYVVTVTSTPAPKNKDQKPPPKILPVVPAKYGDPKTSGLTATIKAGKNNLDLDLKSK